MGSAGSGDGPTVRSRITGRSISVARSIRPDRVRFLHARRADARRRLPAHGGAHVQAEARDWGWADHASSTYVRLGLRRLARITRAVTWKDATRHTCAVHLLRGTWTPQYVPLAYRMEEVCRFLRHSSIAVTERHYAALTLDALPVTPHRAPSSTPTDANLASVPDERPRSASSPRSSKPS